MVVAGGCLVSQRRTVWWNRSTLPLLGGLKGRVWLAATPRGSRAVARVPVKARALSDQNRCGQPKSLAAVAMTSKLAAPVQVAIAVHATA